MRRRRPMMACSDCGGPARIHETEQHWCLEHAPARFMVAAGEVRALDAFLDTYTREFARPDARAPSWRVIAAAAFGAGVRHGRENR